MASVEELLREAAAGRIGVDQGFLKQLLDLDDPAAILRFAQGPAHDPGPDLRIDLDPLLADLFRHYGAPARPDRDFTANGAAVLEFYLDMIRRDPENVEEGLIQALLPFGPHAVPPLLTLYEELGEEHGSDIAFLLAALHVRDPRVLALLVDRLEFDAADGAFCLGLYGDTAARPALEKMLAEVPAEEKDAVELRREIEYSIEQLGAPVPIYEPEPFDIYSEYPKRTLPPFDVLDEPERLAMLASPEPDVRAGAAHSFFNQELNAKSRATLLGLAHADPEASVRGQAWASLGDAVGDEVPEGEKLRDEMIAVLADPARPVEERGGAAVGLHAVADRDDVRRGIEALYEEGGKGRVKALDAMWRSLWQPYAKFFGRHLDTADPQNKDPALLRQALRGAGYFRLTAQIDKIATFFDREEPYDDLREDALFAYALAMPGETTRGRVKGMLRKIDALTPLSQEEAELVQFALDERLRLHGLAPVFEAERAVEHDKAEHDHEGHVRQGTAAPPPEPAPAQKPGRNDPCPCGSGKKYKRCHGA
ncbi:MAG TPA: SEC-C domain-containing protein [Bryobacteraceae bacterium]|nr:SEC-C domain-containing protein [Bryobacteraceae bacterium]